MLNQQTKPSIICTVTTDLNYDQRMIRICSTLAKAGYKVTLIGRSKHNSKPLQTQPFHQTRLNCWFQKGKWFYVEYNIRLFWYLVFKQFDVICGVDLDTILPVYWISRLKNKPCVYDAHEYFTETPEVVGRPTIQRIWSNIAQITLPHIPYNYTVGEGLATIFKKTYQQNYAVIRNVPTKLTKEKFLTEYNKIKTTKKIILYQGALNEGRGLEQAIQAMQYIENGILVLAGEGDLSKQLRTMVKERHLHDKVLFLGYVLPNELKQITQQAYIGLNLLENRGLSYYYSLANKAFDYIQAEKPSINMQFPEYKRINEEYEVFALVPDLEIEGLVDCIQKLLENQFHYNYLVEQCQQAKLVYNWEMESRRLLDFYESIFEISTQLPSTSNKEW